MFTCCFTIIDKFTSPSQLRIVIATTAFEMSRCEGSNSCWNS